MFSFSGIIIYYQLNYEAKVTTDQDLPSFQMFCNSNRSIAIIYFAFKKKNLKPWVGNTVRWQNLA